VVVDLCDDDVDSHSADVDLLQNQLEGIMMELSELPSPTLAHAALLVRGYSGHESARIYKVYVYIYIHIDIDIHLYMLKHGLGMVLFHKSGLK